MDRLAVLLLLLNLADGAATWTGLSLGVITEANPALSWGLAVAPQATIAAKVFGVSGLVVFLAGARRYKWSASALRALTFLYCGVVALHAAWAARLLL